MKNPITKLVAAAIVAVASIAGVVMWTHTGSGIALANVLAQVQQITAYMYQMTITMSGKAPAGQDLDNQTVEGSVLIAPDQGMKMTMDMAAPNGGPVSHTEAYMLPQEKAMITLTPAMKQYVRVELDDTLWKRSREQNYDPGAMLNQILNCKYESLGRSTIDGAQVQGFQTTDPNYLAGMGQVDVKIWVDVKTQLPVRSEMDMQVGDMRVHGVVHDFQWNYPVKADTFKPVIPADYTTLPGGPMKMPAINEPTALEGLKLFADRTGRYPEKLDFATLMGQLSKITDANSRDDVALKKLLESGVSKDEALKQITANTTKKLMDTMMPIQGVAMFYMTLVKDKKEPAYYGNVVTPKDADKVLLRWKLSDNQYRVIFGGLHAETVDAATLAELEKNLPK